MFVSIEKIYQTLETCVSLAIQAPRISSKTLRCSSYFQLSSQCLDIPMKLPVVFDILLDDIDVRQSTLISYVVDIPFTAGVIKI